MKNTCGLLLVVRNEAKRIKECLDWHMPYLDEIAICDQSSDDGTWELLQEYKEKSKIPFFLWRDANRNFCEPSKQATSNLLNTEWVLYIDPDEVFPKEFLERMHDIVGENDLDGYVFPRRNIFKVKVFDEIVPIEPKWLEVEHPSKDYQLRLTRRLLSVFPEYLHNRVRVSGKTSGERIGKLIYGIEHKKTITEQWQDNERYTIINKK